MIFLNAPAHQPMTSTHMNYMMNPIIMVLDKIFDKFFPGLDKYDFDAKLNKKIGFVGSKFLSVSWYRHRYHGYHIQLLACKMLTNGNWLLKVG